MVLFFLWLCTRKPLSLSMFPCYSCALPWRFIIFSHFGNLLEICYGGKTARTFIFFSLLLLLLAVIRCRSVRRRWSTQNSWLLIRIATTSKFELFHCAGAGDVKRCVSYSFHFVVERCTKSSVYIFPWWFWRHRKKIPNTPKTGKNQRPFQPSTVQDAYHIAYADKN